MTKIHVMCDLETMGTRYNAPVLAIGAVYFDPNTGELGDRFYGGIDMDDACRYGVASGSTIKWWMGQSDEARKQLCAGKHPAELVFTKFEAFMRKHGDRSQPWGNGATFDIGILEYAYPRIVKKTAPWAFWNVRDCRTIKEIAAGVVAPFEAEREGTHHNALDDAIHQAAWVSHYWQGLRRAGVAPIAEEVDLLV